MDLLETHTQDILARCERVFVNELDSTDDVSTQIPLVKWECCDQAPGAFALYLLSFSGLHRRVRPFLEEMITHWLAPSADLQIISSKSLIFNIPRSQHPLSYMEIVVPVRDQKTLQTIHDEILTFIDDIQRGVSSVDLANHILDIRRLSLSSKTSSVYESIFALIRRHPKRFSHDIFPEVQHFLLHCSEDFRKIRDARLLCRIICAHYLLKKSIERESKIAPHRRHLAIKILSAKLCYPFGLKKVVGLAISLNRLGDYESFELRHIISAIQRFVPDAYARQDSFYAHLHDETHVRTIYLEIEKEQGTDFTLEELKRLTQELPQDLEQNIEYLSPSLFIPCTEEDLVRSIITLSCELKYASDLPQVLVSFQEQCFDTLKFNIILLRVLKPDTSCIPIQELSKCLPSNVRFIPERTAVVGSLKGKYHKEANIFALEVDNRRFLRQNHSVDLVKARYCVVNALEKMIGPFKDGSGSFLPQPHSKDAKQVIGQQHHQTLRLHLPRAAQSLDPRTGADRTSGIVIRMLYEGLCRINLKGEPEPAIASSISISEDHKKYVFTLKETYWSNGSPLTAYDFEYAWKKILEPDFHSAYSFLFFSIRNAEAVKRGDMPMSEVGIEVLDANTLAVTLEYPALFFLELMASWLFSPLCRAIDQKHPGWAYRSGATHVCNGPFKLDVWKLSDELQLIKNPLYWDAASVKLETVQISVIDDEKKALDLFYHNAFDWVGDPLSKVPPQELASLKRRDLLHTDTESYGLFWLQMNMLKMPFQNTHIRKAFAYGTDRQKLIRDVLHSDDVPAFGFSAIKEQAFPPSFCDGDKERALRYFEEGLQELGITRKELPPIIITHSEIEEQVAISQALAEQWRELFGIEIKFKRVLWNAYFDTLARNDFMIGGLVWYPRFTDPIYFYDLFVSRDYAVKVSTWKNPVYERLIQAAKMCVDVEKRDKLLFEAEKIILEAMPVIPLFYQHCRHIKNPRLQGYVSSNTNQIDFRSAYLT